MPDVSQASEIAPWLQAGGVLGFAGLVYIELRAARAEMRVVRKLIGRASELLAILLDRTHPRSPTGPVVAQDEADDDASA